MPSFNGTNPWIDHPIISSSLLPHRPKICDGIPVRESGVRDLLQRLRQLGGNRLFPDLECNSLRFGIKGHGKI